MPEVKNEARRPVEGRVVSDQREERATPIELRPVSRTEQPSPAEPRSGGELIRRILFMALPIALIAAGYFYVAGGRIMSTDNAYVQADFVAVSTDVSGMVKSVDVKEGQRVGKGDVLFRLDDQPFALALQRAEAQLGNVRNDLKAQQANYADLQAQLKQAQADVDFYTRDFDRQQKLISQQITPQTTFDQSRRSLIGAQQKVVSLNQQLAAAAANLNGNPDAPIEQHPKVIDALAQRDEAARQLSHTIVRAPFDGVATNVSTLQPGQYLQAATAAFSVVATDHVWVAAQPKETELTYVRPGQVVTVTVDTYPGLTWQGTVESISPASGATFSLLPAQNTSGNWVKVVQRIPMRVRIDTPADKPPLRVGMSAEVDVDTGRARGLPSFVKRLFGGQGESYGQG